MSNIGAPAKALAGIGDDGFQVVRGGAPARRTAWGGSSSSGQPASGQAAASKTSWAALAEEDDEDVDEEQHDDDAAMQCDDEHLAPPEEQDNPGRPRQQSDQRDGDELDGEDDDDAAGDTKDEAALKREWTAHCVACRLLEKDGRAPHQLVAEARLQRDSAEKRWRAARTPHPLSKRLRWAESELREAETKEQAHRAELEEHLAQAERRTKALEERLAIDAARTARKREALACLHREGAGGQLRPPAERAAIIAATGISMDVAPALLSAIEKLGTPANEEQEATWRELQLAAVSLSRVEEVLREGVQTPAACGGPSLYNIGDDGDDDGHRGGEDVIGTDGGSKAGGGTGAGDAGRPPAAAAVPRWTKAPNNGPWRRADSSAAAVQGAREALRRRTEGTSAANVDQSTRANGRDEPPAEPAVQSSSTTNDLAEAERRDREAAQKQWHEAQQHQARDKDAAQLQQEEDLRQQREQRRKEELQRHQAEAQRAAEERAAEETRQRELLIANMSPEQLALAAEVHAQQAAIGAKVFGTQEAAQMAGLAHQAHIQRALQEAEERGRRADTDHLMSLSPEEFAQWNRDRQEDW